jgi:hypothetical protein
MIILTDRDLVSVIEKSKSQNLKLGSDWYYLLKLLER